MYSASASSDSFQSFCEIFVSRFRPSFCRSTAGIPSSEYYLGLILALLCLALFQVVIYGLILAANVIKRRDRSSSESEWVTAVHPLLAGQTPSNLWCGSGLEKRGEDRGEGGRDERSENRSRVSSLA